MTANNKTEVIVIGAGISGIKTSIELSKVGISSLILEARDRLGGRLYTEKLSNSGLPIDIGASWFHDCFDNPMLKKYWMSDKVKLNYDDGEFAYFNEDGLIDDNERLKPVAEEIKLYLKNLYDILPVDDDISVKEAVYQYLKDKKWCLTDYQLRHVPQLIRYFELWIGSSWEILSGRSIAADEHKGRDAMVLNGYSTVYNNELSELIELSNSKSHDAIIADESINYANPGGCSIKLNHVVYKIEWDDINKEIIVYCKDNGRVKLYKSNYLVVTVPLSVLKLTDVNKIGAIEWKPPLPKSFTKSLEKVSFSNLGKVFFEFPETFWSLEYDRMFSLANVDEEFYNCLKFDGKDFKFSNNTLDIPIPNEAGNIPNGLDYSILFLNLAKPTKKPIILALISSPLTQFIESQESQDVIFQVFKPVFARISNLKEYDIPKPLEIKTSKWSNDPFARGSYTGITVGDDYETALETLVNPKDIFDGSGRVRFAGEGTIDDGNGCVHTAWNTGIREAENIKRMINKAKL